MLRGGVQQDADFQARVGQVGEAATDDGCRAGRGRGQAHQDPQRGGLAGAVRAEEAGDPARLGGERGVVHGREAAVPFRD